MIDPITQLSGIVSTVASLAIAGLLLAFWLHDRQARWNLFWSAAYGCATPSIGFWLVWSQRGGEFSLLAACVAVSAGSVFLLEGVNRFLDERLPTVWRAGYFLVFFVITRGSAEIGPLWALAAGTGVASYAYLVGGVKFIRCTQWSARGVGMLFLARAAQLALYGPLSYWGYASVAFILGHFMSLATGLGLLFIGFVSYSRGMQAMKRELTERNAVLMQHEEELVASNRSLEELAVKLERQSEEYADARNRADAANQAKSQFLANMSHELRTPLNAIMGFAELITAMPATPIGRDKSNEYAGYVKDAGAHLLNVVNNLLDLARIELNAIEVAREPIALEELVRRAKLLVQFALTAKQIEIKTEMPSGLILAVDPQLMRQALVNVMGNAIKFSPQGSVIRLTAKSLSNGVLCLAVSDSGPGIDSAVREKVFEPFAQAGDVHSRSHGGVGLGLSITRSIIAAHHGTIEASTASDGGTEILICLPVEALAAA